MRTRRLRRWGFTVSTGSCMNGTITYSRTNDVEKVRKLIVAIHVEVRGEFGLMGEPFYAPDRFSDRLTTYASRPG